MRARKELSLLAIFLLIPCIAWTWNDPSASSRFRSSHGGSGLNTGQRSITDHVGRRFNETELGSNTGSTRGFSGPAGAGPSDIPTGRHGLPDPYGNHPDGPINANQNSAAGYVDNAQSPRQGIQPVLEQRNPYYTGESSRNILAGWVNWAMKAPEGLFTRVYDMVDEKVFPAAPATSGSNKTPPPDHDEGVENSGPITPPMEQGFGGGGISPFVKRGVSVR